MKKLILLTLLSIQWALGQIPNGYYDGTDGLTGATLKTELSQIITNGHIDYGYNGLWSAYQTTDRDYFYENDGSILDIYSEKPNTSDAYEYTFGSDQCGSYSGEGSCYNREHIVPQSFFKKKYPMRSDVHFIRPTDGYVNGKRSHYPFGEVGSASFTSTNGSKLGSSISNGYSGTVFEPIDEFKGDVARMVFYFVTRYENKLSQFINYGTSSTMLGGTAYPGLQTWELEVLLDWHNQDPVSNYEIARNNASYNYQGNRNPFIDHPEFVNLIWNYTPDTENPTAPTNLIANNPTTNSIDISWTAATDNIGVTEYQIYLNGTLHSTVNGNTTSATISGLTPNTTYEFYIKAKDSAGNTSAASNTTSETTLENNTGGGTGECGIEDFENIPSNSSSYQTNTWTNNGITWTATHSRTDQSINNRAITIKGNGSLSSSTITGGIGSLYITTQRKFSGSSGTFDLVINGNTVGTIPYDNTEQTTTIEDINIEGSFTIEITNNSNGGNNRIAFDDLSWNCYSLGTDEVNRENDFIFYPNPVKNGLIYGKGKNLQSIEWIKIYSFSGSILKTIQNPFKTKNYINIHELPKGIYLLQTPLSVTKIIVE